MPDNLMAYTSITGEANSHATMLNDGLMASLQDVSDKLLCAVFGDLTLGFVASASGQFYQREKVGIGGSIDKLHSGFNNLHGQTPST